MSALFHVSLFGGVRVESVSGSISPPNTRASVLVAALVLAQGGVVGAAELRGLLWPSGEPATAANQLHRLVGQVRRLFEPDLAARAVGDFVAGSSSGYRLDPTRIRSDVDDCQAALERARGLAPEDREAAVEQYLVVLEVLRHPLLGDGAWEAAGHARFAAVARTRIAVAMEALALAHDSSRLGDVVVLVEQIAAAIPFEEALQARLVRALVHVGRRRDASQLFETVRTLLAEELGVDPGPELREAQTHLAGDEEFMADVSTGRSPSVIVPAQLPSALRGMTSRPLAQELLDRVASQGEAEAVVITSIGGMGGIGKTTLAVAWARSLAPRFPDGQLYVNLRGFDPSDQVMTPMHALGEMLLALGAPSVTVDETVESRSARFRSFVADRRLLLLLDNARDAEQVRPLLPSTPGCLVIVTSRNQLSSLVVREGAVPVRLDRMTDEQSREVLAQRLGAVRLGLEGDAVDRVVAAAAGLPLALAIVSARLAIDPELSLTAVADELAGPQADSRPSPLSGWSAGEHTDLASVFDWSYNLLGDDTARVFRLLAVHPGPEISLPAIASIAGVDLPAARRITSALVGVSLLERRGAGRFVVHDLLREYAASRLHSPERTVAEARLVGHYVRSTRHAWSTFGRPAVGALDQTAHLTGLLAEEFEDVDQATSWYARERSVLRTVLHLAIERGWDRAAANISIDWRPMNQFVDDNSYTYPHALAALEAAKRTEDPVILAELHRDVGPKAVHLGHAEIGQRHLEEARRLFALVGDRGGEANVLRNLATLTTVPREVGLDHLRVASALLAEGQAPQVREVIRVTLAARLLEAEPGETVLQDDCLEAVALLRVSLPVLVEEGWTYLIPSAATTLAHALMRLSRPREALEAAAAGVPYAESDPLSLALLHVWVAEAAAACHEPATARAACRAFHDLIEVEGRGRVELLLATSAVGYPESDAFGRMARIEESLLPSGE